MRLFKRNHHKLLQEGVDHLLTPEEKKRLIEYQKTDTGQLYTAVHETLTETNPPDIPDVIMKKEELKALAAKVDTQVQRKRRTRRVVSNTRTFALATAVVLVLFFIANGAINREYALEPVAPIAAPTPTLEANMRHLDLLTMPAVPQLGMSSDLYGQSIAETMEQVDYGLLVPTQINEVLIFIGSMVNPNTKAVEIAFVSDFNFNGVHPIWVLSQVPIEPGTENANLPTVFQPFYGKAWEQIVLDDFQMGSIAEHLAKVKADGQTTIQVNGQPAIYQVEEHFTQEKEWNLVTTLSWQQDGYQYTLTFIAPTVVDVDSMVGMINNMHLAPLQP